MQISVCIRIKKLLFMVIIQLKSGFTNSKEGVDTKVFKKLLYK